MLRKPNSSYDHGRSHSLLKCKYFHDEEALVTGKENGMIRKINLLYYIGNKILILDFVIVYLSLLFTI